MEALLIGVLLGVFVVELILGYLNQKNMLKPWPKQVRGFYTQAQVKRAVQYSTENHQFSFVSKLISLAVMVTMILEGGFAFVQDFSQSISNNESVQALVFFGVLTGANQIISIPLSYYQTFVIEAKYGFNNSTKKLFVADLVKGTLLSAIIGGGLLFLFGWLINVIGSAFWLVFWGVVVVVMILANAFYTSLILPLFNKLEPIKDEVLQNDIKAFCDKVGFKLTNLYQMDGSKRSKKANAFFSGLGPKKTIVLYDTLIEGQTNDEIIAVLAHEIGHYKKKHTLTNLFYGIAQLFGMLALLGWAVNQPFISQGLGVDTTTFYTGLLAFFVLFSPANFILGMMQNALSRKMEFQADAYAKETASGAQLVGALKKLSVDNLSNLNPHPAYVFFNYSHPPLHQRIKALS